MDLSLVCFFEISLDSVKPPNLALDLLLGFRLPVSRFSSAIAYSLHVAAIRCNYSIPSRDDVVSYCRIT
jgi:hypothetical protein